MNFILLSLLCYNDWHNNQDMYIKQLQDINHESIQIPPRSLRGGLFIQGRFIIRTLFNITTPFDNRIVLKRLSSGMYLAETDDKGLLEIINNNITYSIEPEQEYHTNQNCPLWGLDKLDKIDDCSYSVGEYTGKGSHIYVVDTGIYSNHRDYRDRLGEGFSVIDDNQSWEDCNGHGTHVAGTAAGGKYGVAKDATLHAVRVLGCSGYGSTSGVIEGLEWCLTDIQRNQYKHSVVSMSLGGGPSSSMLYVIDKLIKNNITVVVAAGNENRDACLGSPANSNVAITVGSTTFNDVRSSFSNYGNCVDIFAPGTDILSTWIDNTISTKTISGTSMATPHVSGVVAILYEYMEKNKKIISPYTLKQELYRFGEKSVIIDSKSTNNIFVNIPLNETPYPTPPPRDITDINLYITILVFLSLALSCFMCFQPSVPDNIVPPVPDNIVPSVPDNQAIKMNELEKVIVNV